MAKRSRKMSDAKDSRPLHLGARFSPIKTPIGTFYQIYSDTYHPHPLPGAPGRSMWLRDHLAAKAS